MEKIGEKLYNLRKMKGVSQEALADLVGVSRQTIHKWENDRVQPTNENLLALCKVLEVDKSYFWGSTATNQRNELEEEIAIAESKPKRAKIILRISIIVVAILFLISLLATIYFGFLVHSTNTGSISTNNITIHSQEIYLSLLFSSIALFVIELNLIIIYIKKRK